MSDPLPCELERRTGEGAGAGTGAGADTGMGAGEAAPERACVVRERTMPVLRSTGARWCVCGCVGVRKSGGRLWRDAIGVAMLLLAAAAGAVAGGARTAVAVYGVGVFSPFGSAGGPLRRRETQSPLRPKLRRPHSRMASARVGGTWNSPGEPRVTLRKTSTASRRHSCAMPRRFSRTTCDDSSVVIPPQGINQTLTSSAR